MMGPIDALPLVDGLTAAVGTITLAGRSLPVALGRLPVDDTGKALPLPVLVIDGLSPAFNGPPMGDRHGQADWTVTARVIADDLGQAHLWAGLVFGALFTRTPNGEWTTDIPVDGQWVTNREPAPNPLQEAPSADGIVALVLRFIIRSQRA